MHSQHFPPFGVMIIVDTSIWLRFRTQFESSLIESTPHGKESLIVNLFIAFFEKYLASVKVHASIFVFIGTMVVGCNQYFVTANRLELEPLSWVFSIASGHVELIGFAIDLIQSVPAGDFIDAILSRNTPCDEI